MQRLTPKLLRKDYKFNDAEIAVQSNEERVLLGRLKAISYAKNHNEQVFSWVLNMFTERKGGDKNRLKSYVQAGAKELAFYFVWGMPMIISCKGKIGHKSWQIANGQRYTVYSFIHS